MAAAVAKRGPEYLAAVDPRQRPQVAYRARAKIPRVNRCARAARWQGRGGCSGRASHRAWDVCSLAVRRSRGASCSAQGAACGGLHLDACVLTTPAHHCRLCRRQTVLNKLAGEHLALAAGRRRPLLRPAAAAADEPLR